jgi:hypothetical protein
MVRFDFLATRILMPPFPELGFRDDYAVHSQIEALRERTTVLAGGSIRPRAPESPSAVEVEVGYGGSACGISQQPG